MTCILNNQSLETLTMDSPILESIYADFTKSFYIFPPRPTWGQTQFGKDVCSMVEFDNVVQLK